MTIDESRRLCSYALLNYPGCNFSDQKFNDMVKLWAYEFKDVPFNRMIEVFKYARTESPNWIPSLPQLHQALSAIESQFKAKSPEQQFRDSHGGKSKEEWEAYELWAASDEGKQKIEVYKARLKALRGASYEQSVNL